MVHEIGKVFLFNFKLFFWRFSCQKKAFLWTDLQKNKTVSGVKSFFAFSTCFRDNDALRLLQRNV